MNFNHELYKRYKEATSYKTSNTILGLEQSWGHFGGLFCYPTQQWLGVNGEVDHEVVGKTFNLNGSPYVVDNVYIKWDMGYYYALSFDGFHLSDTIPFQNINSEKQEVLEAIGKFNTRYEIKE